MGGGRFVVMVVVKAGVSHDDGGAKVWLVGWRLGGARDTTCNKAVPGPVAVASPELTPARLSLVAVCACSRQQSVTFHDYYFSENETWYTFGYMAMNT